jgi:thiamine transport system permease protein
VGSPAKVNEVHVLQRGSENAMRVLAALVFLLGSTVPFVYALLRLEYVTGWNVWQAISNFHDVNGGLQALRFTLLEAFASSLLTIVLGLPIAWCLSRYQWKRIRLLRALLAVPFVTPAIVAAMGFLSLFRPEGILAKAGIDL